MILDCKNCQGKFEFTEADKAFLDKFSPIIGKQKIAIPPPTHCNNCRQQRRLAQANQMHLYKRKCDLTGKEIISNYHQNDPYKVYDRAAWFSDEWDPRDFGRDFDFSTPFFEQFSKLSHDVPRPALQTAYLQDINSDYTNYAGLNKNCYLIFDSDENRDCFYSYSINQCESAMDCYRVRKSELCYEAIDSMNCYNSFYLQDCENCADSLFLQNCVGVKNSIMCVNLRNKQYHIKNKPVPREEFEKLKRKLLGSRSEKEQAIKYFNEVKKKFPQKNMHGFNNENVLGDYLTNCKNAYYCFDSSNLWDCRYIYQAFMPLKDCMDIQECGDAELLYECAFAGYESYGNLFCSHVLGSTKMIQYSYYSPNSRYLFGCVGGRKLEYCILNKQYTKEQFEELVPRIIEFMKATKEYGEFFPIKLSSFCYNETLAQEYFPLTKEEALKNGYRWRDINIQEYQSSNIDLPEDISKLDIEICKDILSCNQCKKNYRLDKAEVTLLKKLNIMPPKKCFYCRHDNRRTQRNQKSIIDNLCHKCAAPIKTTYKKESQEIVYCENCYLKALY